MVVKKTTSEVKEKWIGLKEAALILDITPGVLRYWAAPGGGKFRVRTVKWMSLKRMSCDMLFKLSEVKRVQKMVMNGGRIDKEDEEDG